MKTTPDGSPQEIADEIISYLKSLQRRGIKAVYLDPEAASSPRADAAASVQPTKNQPTEEPRVPPPSTDVATDLGRIESEVRTCTLCALHEGRTQTVFGTGDPRTRVMFIGEGPGRDEDLQGKPFVGRSGQLLTKIIEAIDLTRDEVYITNIVKCRPPNNRNPNEDEVRCCERYLVRQIDVIRPRVICALGLVAAQWLLNTKASLGSLRERENRYHDTPVLVTYHPAALLRNPGLKRQAWEDFKNLRSMID